jgi:hypothetical protein
MGENNAERKDADDNMAHVHYMLDISGYKHTFRMCIT